MQNSRNWTDEEIEKAVKKATVGLKILAKEKGMTVEELWLKFLRIPENDRECKKSNGMSKKQGGSHES